MDQYAGVQLPGIPMPPMDSSHGNKVYVQRTHGFSQAMREKVLCAGLAPEEGEGGGGTGATPLATAITIQEYLRPFYTLCHGLLGGLALSILLLVTATLAAE
ncbi:hypothetical protein PR048_027290 [Dryococelus australis]|uniref:Uncharacterized protein n=1 Tax=Dryococelus australis TaxID=614101 RepID=A0ABQ9GGB0_9NEOP|nr:hypothetical protein PR048_027290 [Dryococelus australis]